MTVSEGKNTVTGSARRSRKTEESVGLLAQRRLELTEHNHERDDEGPNKSNHDPSDLQTELSEVSIEPAWRLNSGGRSVEVERKDERRERES